MKPIVVMSDLGTLVFNAQIGALCKAKMLYGAFQELHSDLHYSECELHMLHLFMAERPDQRSQEHFREQSCRIYPVVVMGVTGSALD